MEGNELARTRRQFIKGCGAVVAGAALFGMAGCSPAKTAGNDEASSVSEITWDEEFDVVVVGSGLAGLATAATLATEGDEVSVLLLEKGASAQGNGNSIFSSGVFLATDDEEGFYQYLREMRGNYTTTSDEVLRAFAAGVAENRQWLYGLGCPEDDLFQYEAETLAATYEWGECEHSRANICMGFNKDNEDGMTHPVEFLESVVKAHGDAVTHLTDAALTALVQDPDTKAVLGGVYEKGGKSVYAKAAKGVVMCCGGFENDDVMKQNYLSLPLSHPAAGVCNTGDGHRICQRIGADFWHMHKFAGVWTNAIKLNGSEMAAYRTLKKAQGITVGVNGRRFYMDWDGTTMLEKAYEPGSDETLHYSCRHGLRNYGGSYEDVPMPEVTWFVFDQNGLANSAYLGANSTSNTMMSQNVTTAAEQLADPVADGYGYAADSIWDLASQMGVPAEELTRTVQVWNECCAAGDDTQFHRPAHTLTPIDTAPFYAVKCVPELLNTDGGPVRSAQAEILDVDGQPIPGLYSAGEFGSVWTYKYQGGGNLAECMVFGRIAARNVLSR
ncbi:FAD-dependent oxidoreductase [Rubneribacter sp.]